MNKFISVLLLCAGMVLGIPALQADEAPSNKEETSFWDSLRQKIENLTPKKKLAVTTAVGGVRSALVESEDLYWKGQRKEGEIPPIELEDFNNALVLFESGNVEGAKNAFGRFVEDYPESPLLGDANQALEALTAQPQEGMESAPPEEEAAQE